MELYEHNQIAYQEADKMLKTYGCAAVIHPTGTGKSFIAFKLIEEHPDAQFLWLSPNDYIFESQRRNVSGNFNNVVHMTYTRLIRMNEEVLGIYHSGRIPSVWGVLLGNWCRTAAEKLPPCKSSGTVRNADSVSGQLPKHGRRTFYRQGKALCCQ